MGNDWPEHVYGRVNRYLQLLRGKVTKWRGASTGNRFGVGAGVQIWHPTYLSTGDDVTIMDHSFLDCLSDGGVRIGDHTSFHAGFWLHCSQNENQLGFFRTGSHCLVQATAHGIRH